MTGYLLDTSVLIALVDPAHVLHAIAAAAIDAMNGDDLQYVSSVSIGEIRTGVASVQTIHGRTPTHASQVPASIRSRMKVSRSAFATRISALE